MEEASVIFAREYPGRDMIEFMAEQKAADNAVNADRKIERTKIYEFCGHCGEDLPEEKQRRGFCCSGCANAHYE